MEGWKSNTKEGKKKERERNRKGREGERKKNKEAWARNEKREGRREGGYRADRMLRGNQYFMYFI